MPESSVNISANLWLIATICGGAGAAIIQLLILPVQRHYMKKRLYKNFRRELDFNIEIVGETIDKLEEFKEEHIKLDRVKSFFHFFKFRHVTITFNQMISTGSAYDYLTNDQMLKFDNFISDHAAPEAKLLNEKVTSIRDGEVNKADAATTVDIFLDRYKEHKDNLNSILREISNG